MTKTAESENSHRAPHCSLERVPRILGFTREVPGHWWSSEMAEVDPATKEVAGLGEDNAGKML